MKKVFQTCLIMLTLFSSMTAWAQPRENDSLRNILMVNFAPIENLDFEMAYQRPWSKGAVMIYANTRVSGVHSDDPIEWWSEWTFENRLQDLEARVIKLGGFYKISFNTILPKKSKYRPGYQGEPKVNQRKNWYTGAWYEYRNQVKTGHIYPNKHIPPGESRDFVEANSIGTMIGYNANIEKRGFFDAYIALGKVHIYGSQSYPKYVVDRKTWKSWYEWESGERTNWRTNFKIGVQVGYRF